MVYHVDLGPNKARYESLTSVTSSTEREVGKSRPYLTSVPARCTVGSVISERALIRPDAKTDATLQSASAASKIKQGNIETKKQVLVGRCVGLGPNCTQNLWLDLTRVSAHTRPHTHTLTALRVCFSFDGELEETDVSNKVSATKRCETSRVLVQRTWPTSESWTRRFLGW